MKRLLLILPVVAIATGCVIPWSKESSASKYKAENQRAKRNYEASTNQFTNPKSP